MSEDQRIRELEERVQNLEERIEELTAQSSTALKPQIDKRPDVVSRPIEKNENKAPVRPSEPKEPVDWERLIGQVWLPRIFIFVLLLGVIWGFKAASDYGVLNASVKTIIGYIAGFGLIALGEWQIRKKRPALGQVLLGGSVTVLVIATFAAHVMYGFIGPTFAFSLNLIWVAIGIYFAIRHKSEVLGILGTVGGFLIPFLLDSDTGNTLFFVSYETVFSIIMLLFALKKNYWKLHIVAMVLLPVVLLMYSLFTGLENFPPDMNSLAVLTYGMVVQHLVLLGMYVTRPAHQKVQQSILIISFLAVIFFTYQGFEDNAIAWTLLSAAIVYLGLNVYFHMKKTLEKNIILFPIGLLALMFYFIEVFADRELGLIFLIQGTVAIYLGLKSKLKVQMWSGAFVYLIGALRTVGLQIEVFNSVPMWSWLMLIVTLWFLTYQGKKLPEAIPNELRKVLFGATAVAILVYISQLSYVFTKEQSINTQHVAMTLSWIVYAIGGITYGVLKDQQALRLIGIGLIFLSLGKLIFIDVPNVSIVVRAVLFMIVGATGIVISRFFYTKEKKPKE